MSTVNRVILVGNLTSDAEVVPGTGMTRMKLTTVHSWRDAEGWRSEETEVHEVTMTGSLGKACAKHCQAGRRVYIEGRLRSGQVIADTVRMLAQRPAEEGAA